MRRSLGVRLVLVASLLPQCGLADAVRPGRFLRRLAGETGTLGRVHRHEVLDGGVANAGAVVREGAHVLRPANPHSESIHALLRHVRSAGFDGAPEPLGLEPDGRERLVFIAGQTTYPPWAGWSQTDGALASIARLLAGYHAAARGFTATADWNLELADPAGGEVVCHNDVCIENVVFDGGRAIALLDFDFAAPGRPLWDLAAMAKMCVPLQTPENAARTGRGGVDPFRRLRIVADAYGVRNATGELLELIELNIQTGYEFVRSHVERGEPGFLAMWELIGGEAYYEQQLDWYTRNRSRFAEALR